MEKKYALKALKPYWGQAILVYLILACSDWLYSLIEILYCGSFGKWWSIEHHTYFEHFEYPVYINFAKIFIRISLIPLAIGCLWYFLDIYRDAKPKVVDIFSPYKDIRLFLKIILAALVQILFILLWSLLFIVPGIIKAMDYSQTFYILKDHPEMGVLEAITESKKYMEFSKGQLFFAVVEFTGWGLFALITFGYGFIFVLPYFFTALAAFYEKRKKLGYHL